MRDLWRDDSPRDECGVFAIYAPEMDVPRLTFFALFALQHRGQESAGIAVRWYPPGGAKDMGWLSQVFERRLCSLAGGLAIGHFLISTTGSSEMRNAQPLRAHAMVRSSRWLTTETWSTPTNCGTLCSATAGLRKHFRY
jgi:amidophosphoribosyltransferase